MCERNRNESFEDWLKRKAEKKDKLNNLDVGKSGFGLRRTPLRPISKKQQKRNAEYKKAREEHYSDDSNRSCALCGTRDNLSIHHTQKRGSNTAEKGTFVTLCLQGNYLERLYPQLNKGSGGCHGTVEANKDWAREKGYLV